MKKPLLIFFALGSIGLNLSAQTSVQKVLIEEHTGAWCGYCPDGHVVMDQVLAAYPNAIGAMVHNNDGMDMGAGNTLSSFYVSGFPQATINRQGDAISRSAWNTATSNALNGGLTSVTVSFDSVLYNPVTRKLNVFIKAEFTGNESGDIRFNGILLEDDVTGTGTGFDQTNYYNGTSGHPMYGLGNPIVGYVHDKVARAYFGSAFGTPNSLPTSITAGESFQKRYTYTVPVGYDDTKLTIIGMVSRYDGSTTTSREIINVESTNVITQVNYNVGVDEQASIINAVYPNPTEGIVNIITNVDGVQPLTVTNMLGEVVLSKEVNLVSGALFSIDLTGQPAGLYLLTVGNSSQRIVKK
jgi:hypothetical protein